MTSLSDMSGKEILITYYMEKGWFPVCYDEYDNYSRKQWTFNACSPDDASHLVHRETGRMYRWNQRSRIINHTNI